jgi:hypothetical protein
MMFALLLCALRGGICPRRTGYSQEELAERGERNVALENIVKLAKALFVQPRELFADFS